MIHAVIFDLDGVLVQSEKLKAQSYAVAVQRVLNLTEPDGRAVEAYRETVGAQRDVASKHIVDKLKLSDSLRSLRDEYGVKEPHEVLTKIRTAIYAEMIADPAVIRANQWPEAVATLREVKSLAYRTGLATMSSRQETLQVLRSLEIEDLIDVVVTAEEVEHGKPDPEIYRLAMERLKVSPKETIVLEDSANGVRAAVSAGTKVIAIETPFTGPGLQAADGAGMVGPEWIVHDPKDLVQVVRRRLGQEAKSASPA